MIEKLLENWLDNINERGYQSAFCMGLAAKGFKIIHSTRHAPIELGKDIIALDNDGALIAYQLKGNPGQRLSLRQYSDLQPQIQLLKTTSVFHPSIEPGTPHQSVLVTNGNIEEEVQLAIAQMNQNEVNAGYPDRTLQTMSRGELLHLLRDVALQVWPEKVGDYSLLFELLSESGDGMFPTKRFSALLQSILTFEGKKLRSAECTRQIFSAAILTALVLKNFYNQNNNYACISGWVTLFMHAVALCERNALSVAGGRQQFFDLCVSEVSSLLEELVVEALDASSFVRNEMADIVFVRHRKQLTYALAAIYYLNRKTGELESNLEEIDVGSIIPAPSDIKIIEIFSEWQFPQFIFQYWYYYETLHGSESEAFLRSILSHLLAANNSRERSEHVFSPYYDLDSYYQLLVGDRTPGEHQHLARDRFGGRAWFAEPLLHLLVRANQKQTCKLFWPEFSKLHHICFDCSPKYRYCFPQSEKGAEVTLIPPITKNWDDLVSDSKDIQHSAPAAMQQYVLIWCLYLLLTPHRATPAVVRFLGRHFTRTWH